MATKQSELVVFTGLTILTIEGFEPIREYVTLEDGSREDVTPLDPPGTANFLCSTYGMGPEDPDPTQPGIIWTDYDMPGWEFRILIDSDEVNTFVAWLQSHTQYKILREEEIEEPTVFGDCSAGTVVILRHPDGWVIAK